MNIDNSAYENKISKFDEKINGFSYHKKYGWLRKYADDVITWYSMCGNLQIKAEDFIERILKMPTEYIEDWLDGKNHLEWKPEWL